MRNLLFASLIILLSTLDAQSQLTIKAPNGDVGVGTDDPGAKLDVRGGNALFDGSIGIGLNNPERSFHLQDRNAVLRIDRDIDTPGFIIARFEDGFTQNRKAFLFGVNASGNDDGFFLISDLHQNTSGNSDVRFAIDNTGNVGIGTASPSHKLTVEGDARKTQGGDTWVYPSDKRLKKNIKKYSAGLETIMKMNTVTYEYNGLAGTTDGEFQIGVIAQDIEKIAPFMVEKFSSLKIDKMIEGQESNTKNRKDEIDVLGLNASSIKWMLVDAMQELKQLDDIKESQIKVLKTELDESNYHIKELEYRLENLEKHIFNIVGGTKTQNVDTNNHRNLATISPNPSDGKISICFHEDITGNSHRARVVDLQGIEIMNIILENKFTEINNLDTSSSMLLVTIYDKNNKVIQVSKISTIK